jgi:hypothetical protein
LVDLHQQRELQRAQNPSRGWPKQLDYSRVSTHRNDPMKTDNLQLRLLKQPVGRESNLGVVASRR